jgi:putative cell wall-binding protein
MADETSMDTAHTPPAALPSDPPPSDLPPSDLPPPEPPPAPHARQRLRFREKLPELLLEAASVVFAVLLALGVDEWRENRSRQALAMRAMDSIVRELQANRRELANIQQVNKPELDRINEQVKALEKAVVREIGVSLQLAQLSSAAWQTTQSTEALQLLEFEWLVDVAGTYELQRLVVQTQSDIVPRISEILAAETQRQRLTQMRHLSSRISVLMMLSTQLTTAYDQVLAKAPRALGAPPAN